MAISIQEKYTGRGAARGTSPRKSFTYLVFTTEDEEEDAILDYIAANTPTAVGTLARVYIDVSETGNALWEARVDYAPFSYEQQPEPETGESRFSFSVGTETISTKISKETVHRRALPGDTAPDYKGLINVDPTTGEVTKEEQIVSPTFEFQETHYIATEDVTTGYKGDLFRTTGCTNAEAFKGFEAGEVLFMGVTGSQRRAEDYELTFTFRAQRNRDDIVIGEFVDPFEKKGWEYLWVQYKPTDDEDAGEMVSEPIRVFIERMYDAADFGDLGIGTT